MNQSLSNFAKPFKKIYQIGPLHISYLKDGGEFTVTCLSIDWVHPGDAHWIQSMVKNEMDVKEYTVFDKVQYDSEIDCFFAHTEEPTIAMDLAKAVFSAGQVDHAEEDFDEFKRDFNLE